MIKPEPLLPGMISGIVGLFGSGKSLEGARRTIAKARGGCAVYSSTPMTIDGHEVPVVTPENLMDVRGGFVFLDELHLWLPSRRSLKTPLAWMEWMSQIRKHPTRVEIVYTVQIWSRVDVAMRDLTMFVTTAERWNLGIVQPFVYRTYFAETFGKVRNQRPMKTEIVRRSRTASAAYDTDHRITRASHLMDENDPYTRATERGTPWNSTANTQPEDTTPSESPEVARAGVPGWLSTRAWEPTPGPLPAPSPPTPHPVVWPLDS